MQHDLSGFSIVLEHTTSFSISINETPTRGTALFSGTNDTLGHLRVGANKRK